MPTAEAITLYFREGTSDKQYVLEMTCDGPPLGGRYTVKFSFGRRGTAFQSGRKVADVAEAVARKEFVRLLDAKLSKGYKVEAVGTRGPSINGTLARHGAEPNRLREIARQVVRTSTATTPRVTAPGTLLRPPARIAPPPPAPKPAAPEVDPFGPVVRKIRLGKR